MNVISSDQCAYFPASVPISPLVPHPKREVNRGFLPAQSPFSLMQWELLSLQPTELRGQLISTTYLKIHVRRILFCLSRLGSMLFYRSIHQSIHGWRLWDDERDSSSGAPSNYRTLACLRNAVDINYDCFGTNLLHSYKFGIQQPRAAALHYLPVVVHPKFTKVFRQNTSFG